MKLFSHTENVWTIENFLEAHTCRELIELSEKLGYQEAEVNLESGAMIIKGIRNNSRLIYQNEALANELWTKLECFCPKVIEDNDAIGLNEQFRFYKYELNQRFKKHRDGRFKRNEKEESRITFMIYLNDDYLGGETSFETINIFPQIGMALCFIHEEKHEGCPITEGVKYVLRSDVMYRKKS